MAVTSKSLWYIESHLSGDLSLESIADAVGVSRFHLSRAFGLATGHPLASYVRWRRLTEAARALSQGSPDILAVALDAGYGSHEAFTRAFRQHFGVTPDELRERGDLGGLMLQQPVRITDKPSASLAAPRIVKRDSMRIFGLSERYHRDNSGIPSQWDRFSPYIGHIPGQIGNTTFGVICNADEAGTIDYICGVEVREFPAEPAGFARLEVPAQTYAVFEHRDHVSAIPATWKAIWEHGLSDAGRGATDGAAFERYDERFDPRTGLGGCEIWIPVA